MMSGRDSLLLCLLTVDNVCVAKMGDDNDEEMVRLAFRTLDKDGSGTIDTSEFKHLMTHIGKYYFN